MKPDLKNHLKVDILADWGQRILLQRKFLKVAAESVALAAGISRVTLHRIEKGDPGVSIGAYVSTLQALGMQMTISSKLEVGSNSHSINLSKIAIDEYPELKKISWQLKDGVTLTALEAKNMYERNEKFISFDALCEHEKQLIEHLGVQFKRGLSDAI
jgi:transcriptional regulator with XRE-family HTH domain